MASVPRDTVVIGCSAGGVEILPRVLGHLDAGLRASVVIVLHLPPTPDHYLVPILRRASRIPIAWAEQGEPLELGRVYVAPPGVHSLVRDGRIQLVGGPREHHSRPSIDLLFRSAASDRAARTVGVLMTGMMDDGVAGLRDIHRAGGMTIVQLPADAPFPELPQRALQAFEPHRVLRTDEIGLAIAELAGTDSRRSSPTIVM